MSDLDVRNVIAASLKPGCDWTLAEYKVLTCDIVPGRRPHGDALTTFVDEYRRRAGVA